MKVGFIFPGQGSQAVGMGKDLFEKYDSAKKVFETADNKVIDSVPVVSDESVSIKETVSGKSETHNMQKSGFFSRIISKIKDFFRGEPIGGK